MAAPAAGGRGPEDDDWEICNDDGFVYKRRKRRLDDDVASSSTAVPPDPKAEELRYQRERKKLARLRLREKYLGEIRQWERLDAALQGVVAASEKSSETHSAAADAASADASSCEPALGDSSVHPLVDELLLQAEVQEAILGKLTSMCDIVDSECDSQEENFMQSLFNLPVWADPSALMVALQD